MGRILSRGRGGKAGVSNCRGKLKLTVGVS
jgi:hypothetical protein